MRGISPISAASAACSRRGEASVLAYARGLIHWQSRTRFCGVCGNPCQPASAGHVMHCTGCGTDHFPRSDPAVIMLVVRDDSILMGHATRFPEGMYSTLAGFVEPGESLEEAVRREVYEETGVRVGAVAYHSSQPWPFPSSLMLGFYGEGLTEEIEFRDAELAGCAVVHPRDVPGPGGARISPAGCGQHRAPADRRLARGGLSGAGSRAPYPPQPSRLRSKARMAARRRPAWGCAGLGRGPDLGMSRRGPEDETAQQTPGAAPRGPDLGERPMPRCLNLAMRPCEPADRHEGRAAGLVDPQGDQQSDTLDEDGNGRGRQNLSLRQEIGGIETAGMAHPLGYQKQRQDRPCRPAGQPRFELAERPPAPQHARALSDAPIDRHQKQCQRQQHGIAQAAARGANGRARWAKPSDLSSRRYSRRRAAMAGQG